MTVFSSPGLSGAGGGSDPLAEVVIKPIDALWEKELPGLWSWR